MVETGSAISSSWAASVAMASRSFGRAGRADTQRGVDVASLIHTKPCGPLHGMRLGNRQLTNGLLSIRLFAGHAPAWNRVACWRTPKVTGGRGRPGAQAPAGVRQRVGPGRDLLPGRLRHPRGTRLSSAGSSSVPVSTPSAVVARCGLESARSVGRERSVSALVGCWPDVRHVMDTVDRPVGAAAMRRYQGLQLVCLSHRGRERWSTGVGAGC